MKPTTHAPAPLSFFLTTKRFIFQLALDGATVKAVVAAVDVMGGTVTVAQDVAKEQALNLEQERRNGTKIAEARARLVALTLNNQELTRRGKAEAVCQPTAPGSGKGLTRLKAPFHNLWVALFHCPQFSLWHFALRFGIVKTLCNSLF